MGGRALDRPSTGLRVTALIGRAPQPPRRGAPGLWRSVGLSRGPKSLLRLWTPGAVPMPAWRMRGTELAWRCPLGQQEYL